MAGSTRTNNHTKYLPPSDKSFHALSQMSFRSIYALRNMFRMAGGRYDEYNTFEMPGTFFFKIFFYFDNRCYSGGDMTNAANFLSTDIDNLLVNGGVSPRNTRTVYEHTFANSALNYLLINNEYERAELLLQFISLLSSINTFSPWYFSEIGGLSEAVERKEFADEGFKIEDTRRALTIKCIPDAMDARIGTLLDLYREICYSYVLKKEIVPANLRKFDMGIYLFSTPLYGLHRSKRQNGDNIEENFAKYDLSWLTDGYCTSSKYLEFHNCEIDINSSKSAYETMNNAEGSQLTYTINLKYDSCYERRYNEFLMREIGDAVYSDMRQSSSGGAIAQHIQGNIPMARIPAPQGIITAQTYHQRDLDDRVTLTLPSIEIQPTTQYAESNDRNIYDDTTVGELNEIDKDNINSANENNESESLAEETPNIWFGNMHTDDSMDNNLARVEQIVDNIRRETMPSSAIANLFEA